MNFYPVNVIQFYIYIEKRSVTFVKFNFIYIVTLENQIFDNDLLIS